MVPKLNEKGTIYHVEHIREGTHSQQPENSVVEHVHPDLEHKVTTDQDPWLHRGSPSKRQFRLWRNTPNALKGIALDPWIPWKLFALPIVEFAAFVVSWSASSFLTLNLTQSQNFAAPPYGFSSQSIRFMNFAILVGAFIGLLTNGPLSDWVAARATKKNRGIREPEMRLPAMIPYVLIMLLGNFVVAFGYEYKWNWKVRKTDHSAFWCMVTFDSTRQSLSLATLVPVFRSQPYPPSLQHTLWTATSLLPVVYSWRSPSTRMFGSMDSLGSLHRG